MNGKGGSSLGTLLFSVPLAAIPLMAIFGIPQFAPLVASPERTRGYGEQEDAPAFERRRPGDERYADELEPETEDGTYPADDRRGPSHHSHAEHRDVRGTREEWPRIENAAWPTQTQDDYRDESRESPRAFDRQPAAPGGGSSLADSAPPAAGGLTWQSAAQQFEELGINSNSYHLEAGSSIGTFLFVCSFCTTENPNVTMRFESEAPEPLDAVSEVLAQIDNWQSRQNAP